MFTRNDDEDKFHETVYAGTDGYMSPEKCKNKKYTYLSDIYSFGVLAYQLLYKYEKNLYQVVGEEIQSPKCKYFYSDSKIREMYDFMTTKQTYLVNGEQAIKDRKANRLAIEYISASLLYNAEDRIKDGNPLEKLQSIIETNILEGRKEILQFLEKVPFPFKYPSEVKDKKCINNKDLTNGLGEFVQNIEKSLYNVIMKEKSGFDTDKEESNKAVDALIIKAVEKEKETLENNELYAQMHKKLLENPSQKGFSFFTKTQVISK